MEKQVFQTVWQRICNLFATKAELSALDDSKQDKLTAGTGISIDSDGTISAGSDVEEVVHITVTTTVDGVSVEGLSILVYYNDAVQPATTLTTDAQGMASVRVKSGYRYRLVFPSIDGCREISPVEHVATMSERSIDVAYEDEVAFHEKVRVFVKQKSTATVTALSGVVVSITVGNTTTGYTTDNNGIAEAYIPIGASYQVSVPSDDEWETPSARTFTAQQSERTVIMTYRYITSGVFVVDTECNDWTLDDFMALVNEGTKQLTDAVMIKVSTDALVNAGSVFLMDIDLIGDSVFTSKVWGDNKLIASIPTNGNSSSSSYYYDGLSASRLIQQYGDENSINTPAVDYALEQTKAVGETTCIGFLPSVGQMSIAWANRAAIDDVVESVRPDKPGRFSNMKDNKWTSTQFSAGDAWYWTTAANIVNKLGSCAVVPFFAY